MNLQTLLADATVPALELTGLSEHTADVAPGFAFIGVATDQVALARHCRAAVAQGAVALLCDQGAPLAALRSALQDIPAIVGGAVPIVQLPDLPAARGRLAVMFYGDPSAALTCIGVTGTNGKTSVAYHLADMSARLGMPLGYSGTLGWGCLQDLHDANMTTGDAVALQRQLAAMRDAGMAGAALEVSSHALAQDRARAVRFDYAVFTNLTRDHLDYHGSFDAYGAAKAKLFGDWPLQAAIINVDDDFGASLARRCPSKVVTYGKRGEWRWHARALGAGSMVSWHTPAGAYEASVAVVADYAIANVTAALATLVAAGHTADEVFASLSGLRPVPGRMELVGDDGAQPTVVVDYAHSPDALTKVLAALRPFCRGQLVCVVGCGGDRDVGKRPLMGAAAANGADRVWLTSDNPRSEAAADIIAAMRAGIDSGTVHECADRAEAIRQALAQAQAGDVVLVAGKGHEDYQEIAGQRLPFDDRRVVEQALQELR